MIISAELCQALQSSAGYKGCVQGCFLQVHGGVPVRPIHLSTALRSSTARSHSCIWGVGVFVSIPVELCRVLQNTKGLPRGASKRCIGDPGLLTRTDRLDGTRLGSALALFERVLYPG